MYIDLGLSPKRLLTLRRPTDLCVIEVFPRNVNENKLLPITIPLHSLGFYLKRHKKFIHSVYNKRSMQTKGARLLINLLALNGRHFSLDTLSRLFAHRIADCLREILFLQAACVYSYLEYGTLEESVRIN